MKRVEAPPGPPASLTTFLTIRADAELRVRIGTNDDTKTIPPCGSIGTVALVVEIRQEDVEKIINPEVILR